MGGDCLRKKAEFQLSLQIPCSREDRQLLSKRVAAVHAGAVGRRLNDLRCPQHQKQRLLSAVIQTVKEQDRERN